MRNLVRFLTLVFAGVPALSPATERIVFGLGGTEPDGGSFVEDITPDGRFIAFTSSATNLVTGDTNGVTDCFVLDRTTGEIERVSVDSMEGESDEHSAAPRISADGRFVAFRTSDDELVTGDANGQTDVVVRDRTLGTTFLASVGDMEESGNDAAIFGDISGNGRYVAFQSEASNLVMGDTNLSVDIFVRDLVDETTTRVSISDSEAEGTGGDASSPSISDDGNRVAFLSGATNLVPNDSNGVADVFVRDIAGQSTILVSSDPQGNPQDGGSFEQCVISGDGSVVAFGSSSGNLDPLDTDGVTDVYARVLSSSSCSVVSIGSAGQNGTSFASFPTISQNGRYVGFQSGEGIDPRNTQFFQQGHVRDRKVNRTSVVGFNPAGVLGNGSFGSGVPLFTNSGAFAFDSDSTDLLSDPIASSHRQIYFVEESPTTAALKKSLRSKIKKTTRALKKAKKKKKKRASKVKRLKRKLRTLRRRLAAL